MKIPRSILTLLVVFSTARADWALKDDANTDLPGRKVDITQDGVLRARLIYGEGQIKPYLRVQGEEGDGLNEWSDKQTYPHHRGIYIGWNKIVSDLGSFDLWHMNNGGRMTLVKLEKLEGGKDSATIVSTIEWRGGKKDAGGGDLLHAGVHFRASASVQARAKDTTYVWEPDLAGPGGKVASKEMKWVRYTFPIGERWYHATQFNVPTNPVEELSWRDYGRFGFFFSKALKKDEAITLKYRFVTEGAEGVTAKPTDEQRATFRKAAQVQYEAFVK